VIVPDPEFNYLRLTRPVNVGARRFQGAEVSFTSFLDFEAIPEWARAFGLQANATYIDSTKEGEQPFQGVSKYSYNLVALYEKPFFSARLAYNYRSEFAVYYSFEPLDPGYRAVTERGRGQLDFSMTVTPIPNITVAFDVVNVLGNPLQRYREYNDEGDSFERQTIYLERTYSLGVRFRF
jgi:outer membrane receptor protein involved in Fe transport